MLLPYQKKKNNNLMNHRTAPDKQKRTQMFGCFFF